MSYDLGICLYLIRLNTFRRDSGTIVPRWGTRDSNASVLGSFRVLSRPKQNFMFSLICDPFLFFVSLFFSIFDSKFFPTPFSAGKDLAVNQFLPYSIKKKMLVISGR